MRGLLGGRDLASWTNGGAFSCCSCCTTCWRVSCCASCSCRWTCNCLRRELSSADISPASSPWWSKERTLGGYRFQPLLSSRRYASSSHATDKASSNVHSFSRRSLRRSSGSEIASMKCCLAKRSCTAGDKSWYARLANDGTSAAGSWTVSPSFWRRLCRNAWCNSRCYSTPKRSSSLSTSFGKLRQSLSVIPLKIFCASPWRAAARKTADSSSVQPLTTEQRSKCCRESRRDFSVIIRGLLGKPARARFARLGRQRKRVRCDWRRRHAKTWMGPERLELPDAVNGLVEHKKTWELVPHWWRAVHRVWSSKWRNRFKTNSGQPTKFRTISLWELRAHFLFAEDSDRPPLPQV